MTPNDVYFILKVSSSIGMDTSLKYFMQSPSENQNKISNQIRIINQTYSEAVLEVDWKWILTSIYSCPCWEEANPRGWLPGTLQRRTTPIV